MNNKECHLLILQWIFHFETFQYVLIQFQRENYIVCIFEYLQDVQNCRLDQEESSIVCE